MSALDMYIGAEDLGLDENAGPVVEVVEEVVKVQIAELATVIEEQSAQIETLVGEVISLDETVEELEESIEGMESLLGSGNFNSSAFAGLYNRGMKLAQKLGADIDGNRMGAESCSDVATAEMMARTGTEGFMEAVKGYGKKAIDFVKHIFNTVIAFITSIFSQADGLQKRATTLKARIDAVEKVKEKIHLGGWNAHFDYNANGLKSTSLLDFDATAAAIGDLVGLSKNITGITLGEFNAAYHKILSAIKSDGAKMGRANSKKQGAENVTIGIHAGLRYRVSYVEKTPVDLKEAAGAARSLKFNLVKDPGAAKLVKGEVKSKMDKAGLSAFVAALLKEISGLRALGIDKKFSAAERDRVVASLNSVKAESDDKAKTVNQQVDVVRAVYAVGSSLTQSVMKALAADIRAGLDGAAAHV